MKKTLKLFLFFLLFSLSSKAQVCDSLISCDSITKAITDLQKYHVGGDTVTYSAAFIDGYLNLRYPNHGYSPAKWDSIIRCCTPAYVDLNENISSHCENLLFVRLYMQNLFPSRACLPAWLYTYLLNQITPSIPDVTDTTVQELCRELAACKYTCLSYCDTAIITQCDSIVSTYYAAKNVNYAEGITDTNTLVNAYGILFGYTLPYNQIIAMVNNCNPNDTAVFTEIIYSARNVAYSTDTLGHTYLDFDLFATDTPTNLLFAQSNIFVQYDSTIFGTNLVGNGKITASKGNAVDSPYYNLTLIDSTPTLLKIAITHTPNPSSLTNLDSANQQLCHLKLNLSGFNLSAVGAYFDTLAMANHSSYQRTPNGLAFPYNKILVSGLNAPLTNEDSIYYQLTFDTIVNNYLTSIYSEIMIFEVQAFASQSDYLYNADPVITYNTNTFGTNVVTNGMLTCTNYATSAYDFIIEDFNPGAFQIHLDGSQTNFDLINQPDSVITIGPYPIISLATCSLHVQNPCSRVSLSPNNQSRGYWAYADSLAHYEPFAVGLGNGIDTTAPPNSSAGPYGITFYPTTITAGTFDTLTINGAGFGCSQGIIQFTNVQGGGWVTAQPSDIVSWADNEIKLIVASCQLDYGDNLIPGTGPMQIFANNGSPPVQTSPLTIPYAVLNDRLPSGKAIRMGLWGAGAGGQIQNIEYTFIADTSVTSHSDALSTITHAMKDWVCATGVRFRMGTPVTTSLIDTFNYINSITFGDLHNSSILAKTTVYGSAPIPSINGDTVKLIIEEDYMFNTAQLNPNLNYQWFLGDTFLIPTAQTPYLGYYSLLYIARHEYGHGMGLRHVSNTTDLMYPIQQPNFCDVIHGDDANGGVYELTTVAPFISQAGLTPNPQQFPYGCPNIILNGITDLSTAPYNIIIFPNPFDQNIIINADLVTPSEVKFELTNVIGQLIYLENFGIISDKEFHKTISTEAISKGIYLLKISINNSVVVFKLVKN